MRYPTYEGLPPIVCPYCGPRDHGLLHHGDAQYTISCIICNAEWKSQCGITWVEMPTQKWYTEMTHANSDNR